MGITNTGSQYSALTSLHTGLNRRQKDNIQKEDSKEIRRDEFEILEESKNHSSSLQNALHKISTKTPNLQILTIQQLQNLLTKQKKRPFLPQYNHIASFGLGNLNGTY